MPVILFFHLTAFHRDIIYSSCIKISLNCSPFFQFTKFSITHLFCTPVIFLTIVWFWRCLKLYSLNTDLVYLHSKSLCPASYSLFFCHSQHEASILWSMMAAPGLYSSLRATIVNHHKLGGLNNRSLSCHSSGG